MKLTSVIESDVEFDYRLCARVILVVIRDSDEQTTLAQTLRKNKKGCMSIMVHCIEFT